MSLIIKNKNSNYFKSFNFTTLDNEYTCIGSYEDKPTNRIYYFLHSNDSVGVTGKYDCIVEYDQFKDKTFVVYQDGKKGSNGSSEGILNFHKSHLITGINKVEDTLYFTDNFNRPRKINVEKAKRNEENIKLGPTFQSILKEDSGSNTSAAVYGKRGLLNTNKTIITGVTNNHPFVKNDNLYLHQFGLESTVLEGRGYNGYAKAIGIVKSFNKNVDTISIGSGQTTLTATPVSDNVSPNFTQNFKSGDYVCIVVSGTPVISEIDYINNDSSLELSSPWDFGSLSNSSLFNLTDFNPLLNTDNAIITDTPFFSNAPSSPGGKVLYAEPDDAYSPLISFGSYNDKIKYIDALAHQPKDKPEFSFSRSSLTLNNLIGKFFQFRYRYVYKDGSVSAYSGISDVANQAAYAIATTSEDNNSMNRLLNDTIHIEYNDSISSVDKIEIVARDGNKGEFFLIGSIENDFIKYLKKRKNEDLISTPSLYFGGLAQTDIAFSKLTFKNDSIYAFVDTTDLDKLQDSLPKKAKAQIVLPKNRIAYGNVVDGYDNTDIYCNMEFENVDSINAVEESMSTTLEVVNAGAPESPQSGGGEDTVFKFEFDLGALQTFDGSQGTKNVNIDIEWNKFLFQNHQSGGVPYGSIIPRSGKFIYNGAIDSPQVIDDIGLHIQDDINIFAVGQIESNEATFSSGLGFSSEPNTVSASYDSNSKKITFNFTYTKENNHSAVQQMAYLGVTVENQTAFQTLNHDTAFSVNDNNNLIQHFGASGDQTNNNSTYKSAAFFGKSYKAGANHIFGLVYYDETNRCSFVNRSKSKNKFNSGTKIYSNFYSQRNVPQSTFNRVNWKIYHRPPEWATHYQWVYGGNTSVDEFIQIPIHAAYKGNSENKIYLSLGALKGEDSSYNEKNPSLIDYQYVEGDRVRFISFGGDDDGDESARKYFKEYIDVPIVSYDLYDVNDIIELTSETEGTKPMGGYFIVIKNPTDSTGVVEFSNANQASDSYSTADISYTNVDHQNGDNGYHKLVVEIYRPKKVAETGTSSVYYEVGQKYEIEDAGTSSRRHQGQSNSFFFDSESGMEVTAKDSVNGIVNEDGDSTTNYSSGVLESGDTYTRIRKISYYRNDTDAQPVLTDLSCESYYLSDFYQSNNWNQGRINVENPYSEERRLIASIYYSDTFSGTTNYNGLSSFNFSEISASPYFDYNQDFGSIQSLMLRGDDLIIFHENKVCRVLVGKNVVNYADGDSNVTLSNQVLSDYTQVYSGDNGCSLNPESIVKDRDRFYFVDIKRGCVMRLSADGLTKISEYGLSDYIRDLGEIYVITNPEESTDGEFKIVAGYDPKYNEYIVTFPSMINSEDSYTSGQWSSQMSNWNVTTPLIENLSPELSQTSKTISFNESLKKWTSFYSYKPEFYGRINNQFVTYKSGKLYKQNSPNRSNFNTFYGNLYNSEIEFPFNLEPSSVKSYNAISLESDTKLLTDLSTNMGQHNNSYDSFVSTNIGYKKVDGVVSTQNKSPHCLYGSGGCNFYKDLHPGDLIKVYVNGSKLPEYNVVRNILTKEKITLDSPIGFEVTKGRIEVIDYKTKEGVQYSQIPFAPSKTDVDQYGNFQGNYDGDASNIFGLGMFTARINNNFGVLDNVNGNLPFLGNISTPVSSVIPGGLYGILTSGKDFDYSIIFDINYSASTSGDILSDKGSFNNASDWTVVSSGAVIQKNKKGKGNLLMFKNQSARSEIKTASNLNFRSESKYEVSFYVNIENKTSNNPTLSFRLGSSGYNTIEIKPNETSGLHTLSVVTGDKNIDPNLYIKSSSNSPEFSIKNLKVREINVPKGTYVAKSSTSSISQALVYPCEYSLYCLDTKAGNTSHIGWVYSIENDLIRFDVTGSDDYLKEKKFYFIVKEGLIDGEKLKGHYLRTNLKSHSYQSKYKFNLYSANVDVDKSELSGNK